MKGEKPYLPTCHFERENKLCENTDSMMEYEKSYSNIKGT